MHPTRYARGRNPTFGVMREALKIFFLGCVVVAGVFGGMTAKTSILFTQALSVAIAPGAVLLAPGFAARLMTTAAKLVIGDDAIDAISDSMSPRAYFGRVR